MNNIDDILAALAEPSRRRLVELLRSRPWRASDLAVAMHMTPPALSRHLRVLRRCGLIEEDRVERDARVRLYSLRRDRLQQLTQWLDTFDLHRDAPLTTRTYATQIDDHT